MDCKQDAGARRMASAGGRAGAWWSRRVESRLYSDDINIMPFTTLLSDSAICAESRVVKGIICMSSKLKSGAPYHQNCNPGHQIDVFRFGALDDGWFESDGCGFGLERVGQVQNAPS